MEITATQALAIRADGEPYAFLDVRDLAEYEKEQIPGASPLPRKDLEREAYIRIPERQTRILLYSNGEGRAQKARETLLAMGYAKVYVLSGGLNAWKKSGRETVRGLHVKSKVFGEYLDEVAGESRPVKPEVLHSWLESGQAQVIEVRPMEEARQTGSVPGALPGPGVEFLALLPALAKEEKKIVVTCAGRTRGILAAAAARALGFSGVYNLENGTLGWRLAGYDLAPLKGEMEKPPKSAEELLAKRSGKLAKSAGISYVTPEQLRQWLARKEKPVLVLDVRQRQDYEKEHIEGAVSYPAGQAVQNTDCSYLVRRERLVMADEGETRAVLAAYWYGRMGIREVYVLAGGLSAWKAAGFPTEHGQGAGEEAKVLGLLLRGKPLRQISPEELVGGRSSLQRFSVIDVDDGRGFAAGHLPGAAWIPRGRLEWRIGTRIPDRETPLLLTSRDGREAAYAAASLRDLSYQEVSVLSGGKQDWRKAGGHLLTGADGECLDDWQVRLTEFDLTEARAYFAWEHQLLHEEKYLAVLKEE